MADYHVTLYSGPQSREMESARSFLRDRGIHYEEKNIVTDSGARGELMHHTNKTDYPAINVDGHLVVGFFPDKWDHLLGNSAPRRY